MQADSALGKYCTPQEQSKNRTESMQHRLERANLELHSSKNFIDRCSVCGHFNQARTNPSHEGLILEHAISLTLAFLGLVAQVL
jgi:hypothetical protein